MWGVVFLVVYIPALFGGILCLFDICVCVSLCVWLFRVRYCLVVLFIGRGSGFLQALCGVCVAHAHTNAFNAFVCACVFSCVRLHAGGRFFICVCRTVFVTQTERERQRERDRDGEGEGEKRESESESDSE